MCSYIVIMIDRETGEHQRIMVRSECPHGMQEFIDELARKHHPDLRLSSPVIIDVIEVQAPVLDTTG